MPVYLELENEEMREKEEKDKRRKGRRKKEERPEKMEIVCWNTKAKEKYKKKTEEAEWEEKEEESIEETWRRLKDFIKKALVYRKKKILKKRKIGHKD